MNILVTGASGFLGTHLVRRLTALGHRVIAAHSRNADLRLAGSLDALEPGPLDEIWHLAAWTQAGDFCLHHPAEQWIINQQIHTHVLAWWRERQPRARMIGIGTSCSYAPGSDLREDLYLEGKPIEGLFTYAMTKRMLLAGMEACHRQDGLQYLHLVPSTLYGPGYHTDGRQLHFIFDLIRKILAAKHYGTPVVLWGDGHQKRELVFIDDFLTAALDLRAAAANTTVNIGAGEEHSIRDFAQTICELLDFPFEQIAFDTSRYVGARSKVLNVDRLRELLPTFRTTPLRAGLRTTIEWMRTHPETFIRPD